MKRLILSIGLAGTAALASAQLALMPVHDAPKWKVVTGLPSAPGAAIAVSSLSTNLVIGQMKADEKFLAFGTDGKVVTLAFNGTIGYIPANTAKDVYPVEPPSTEWKSYGASLEQMAEEEKSKEHDIHGRSLAPLPKATPKASGAAGGSGGAPGGAMDAGGGRRGGGGNKGGASGV